MRSAKYGPAYRGGAHLASRPGRRKESFKEYTTVVAGRRRITQQPAGDTPRRSTTRDYENINTNIEAMAKASKEAYGVRLGPMSL